MWSLTDIFSNNRAWVEAKLAEDRTFFDRLVQGQSPRILYIGCSDSRVSAEEIMGLDPGEMFVHRNIANMVSSLDISMMSGIEYAVNFLGVGHIVVCGHYDCGGVEAAMGSADLGILSPWLQNIRDVHRLHQLELEGIPDQQARYRRLVELNVEEQCINLIKTLAGQRAYMKGKVKIHGWVFDFKTGLLTDLKIDLNKIFSKIMPIYRLD